MTRHLLAVLFLCAACGEDPAPVTPLDPWLPPLGVEGDARIAKVVLRAVPPTPPSRSTGPTIRPNPFDLALPTRIQAITVHLAPGVGADWSVRRGLASTLRSRLGIGTGAPDVEVVAPWHTYTVEDDPVIAAALELLGAE